MMNLTIEERQCSSAGRSDLDFLDCEAPLCTAILPTIFLAELRNLAVKLVRRRHKRHFVVVPSLPLQLPVQDNAEDFSSV